MIMEDNIFDHNVEADMTQSLGERLRGLRDKKGISLKELAETSGLSRSYLTQIESGAANPSLGSIKRIANVLDVRLFELFSEEEAEANDFPGYRKPTYQKVGVVRRDGRKTLGWPNSKGTTYLLTPDLQGRLEVVLSTLLPGEGSGENLYTHEGEEFGYVLEGTFEVVIEGKSYILKEGDSISFSSRIPHRTRVVGDKPATTLWVISPPSF